MTGEPIPVAVVGAGNMGANHVRVYDELSGANLVAVVEPDDSRAREIRAEYDVEVLDAVEELSGVRAVSISVPNELHREVAEACAEMGLDILVEKPLALTVENAEAIVAAAEEHDVLLQVGHIERFNPAVQTLQEIMDTEEIIAIEAHRLGPFNEHLIEESVIFDLMIHDIDVIAHLIHSPITHTNAIGVTSRSERIDHAIAHLKFENGILGTATASHVTHGKVRQLTVTTKDAYVKLDYQDQRIAVQRRGVEETTPLQKKTGYRTETITETPFIRVREPLKVELDHFLSCVRDREPPLVGGEDGVRAVELATEVVRCIDRR